VSTEALVSVERLVRVETKMDLLLDQGERLRIDHENRLRTVELAVTELKTRAALVAGSIGTATGVLTALVAHFIGG
jgi:dihydrodipicolinate synthase/N-acetylneuraminate lyase